MPLETRLEDWIRKMGYSGEIPSNLAKICNPSTAFIWEQLISNVKPRQEIQSIRHNIIANRLSQKSMEEQDQFSYPLKEIQVYMEKLKLEKRVRYLEKIIAEKEIQVDEVLNKNKVTYVTIDNIKARIKEHQEKKFLLDRKSKIIEADLQQSQDILTLARNLTPVEMEASANGDEITNTLQQCAEKLQKLADTVTFSNRNKNRSLASVINTSKTSKHSTKNTLSQYVNKSTVLTDIAPSCKKRSFINKENIKLPQQCRAACRPLKFTDSTKAEENALKKLNNKRTPKRESLGILPDDCLNVTDEIDTFFLDISEHEDWTLHSLSDSLLEPRNKSDQLLEKLRGHENVKEVIADLLHQNNRYLIVTQCKNIYEELFREMSVSFMECSNVVSSNNAVGQSDISELYFIHIEGELEKEKSRLIKKKLQEMVQRKREEILLCDGRGNKDETKKKLDSQIEQAYVTGANNFLRDEVNSSKKPDIGNEIDLLNLKAKQIKEEIANKVDDIQNLISSIYKVAKDIRKNREEAFSCVKTLKPYVHNLNWAAELTKDVNSLELEVFKKFPLEYNRKLHNHSNIFYREVVDTTIPSYINLDSNDLNMLTLLMNAPFTFAENVTFDFFQTRMIANKLQSVQSLMETSDVNYNRYILENLDRREHYLKYLISKLDCIINSKSVKQVLSSVTGMQEITNLWQEMFFRNFISKKREVDGHNYNFYEQKLKNLREN